MALTRTVRGIGLVVSVALGLFLGGCRSGPERRADPAYHAKGVLRQLENTRQVMARAIVPNDREYSGGRRYNPGQDMTNALDMLGKALDGLPLRIEKKAETRKEDRKAAAEKAKAKFDELRPVLMGLKYDAAEMNAKLDEIADLVRQAEKE